MNRFSYLFHYKLEGALDDLVKNLNGILPESFKSNFNNALYKFNKITDYDSSENCDLFESEDDFAEENSEALRDILEKYINSLAMY